MSPEFDVKTLMNSMKLTLQFENKIDSDLKQEYSEYIKKPESIRDSEDKDADQHKKSLPFQITSLYKVRGSISGCFEDYLTPYINREESDLVKSIMENLNEDLENPVENSMETDNIKILNSSLIMFPNIKHLIKRGSSISGGRTLYEIFKIVPKVIQCLLI